MATRTTNDGAEPTLAETIVAMKAANDQKLLSERCALLIPEIERLKKIIDDYAGITQAASKEIKALREGGALPAFADAQPKAVAWAVVWDSREEIDCEFVYPDKTIAGDVALENNGGVVPLYRHPQPTLTDAEREAVAEAAQSFDYDDQDPGCARIAATLRGLLERL